MYFLFYFIIIPISIINSTDLGTSNSLYDVVLTIPGDLDIPCTRSR